jgi:ATP-dependent RNA helicase MSS116
LQSGIPIRSFSSSIRWRQEALAEAPDASEAATGELTKFQELVDRGLIHANVIDALTKNGLITMTDVQSATINQTLKGTDV